MPPKKAEHVCKCVNYGDEIKRLGVMIDELASKVEGLCKPKTASQSIHKVESFNNETPSNDYDDRYMGMNRDDKIQSMKNAIAILPPNFIKEGRHSVENVQAICGFMVTDEMMDLAYEVK